MMSHTHKLRHVLLEIELNQHNLKEKPFWQLQQFDIFKVRNIDNKFNTNTLIVWVVVLQKYAMQLSKFQVGHDIKRLV